MKLIIGLSVVAAIIVGGFIYASFPPQSSSGSATGRGASSTDLNNVSIVEGVQMIDISVKGGYEPEVTTAQANVPTVLRFNTQGTFDCSSQVLIPSLGIERMLAPTAVTEVSLDAQKPGVLQGMCGMGMYQFEINFQG